MIFSKTSGDSGKTWKKINSKLGKQRPKTGLPKEMVDNDIVLTKPVDIANKLNHSFATKGPKLAQKLPRSNKSHKDFMSPRVLNYLKFDPISAEEIINIVRAFVTNKATGHDQIPAKILKWSIELLAPLLAGIFDSFIEKGEYPEEFKIARVVALHKKGPKNDSDNYRPISILTQLNKILEKIIHTKLMTFLDKEGILTHPGVASWVLYYSFSTSMT